ncbi:phenylacetate--CoA ligase family protein [Mesorhizobium yinganensis]|uniref:phenylacetate--CoA ligase family protein n=1 Tax=Mesorhizobium yinganensis TaxID=3157707 RepID=UPI0032B74A86
MTEYFDALETRSPEQRDAALFSALPAFLAKAARAVPAFAAKLGGVDPAAITDRAALAKLPVLRKSQIMAGQAEDPPFGGLADPAALAGRRIFQSPGPIWVPEDDRPEAGRATARAFFAAGIRSGDTVHNTFSHHMTPGGFLLDAGARALGCSVFPAGVGSTDLQVEAAAGLKPSVYCGTPDFLKVLLDRAAEMGKDLSSFRKALVTAGALFPSLRAEYFSRGVSVMQCYATAEFGVIAYETAGADGQPNPGMVVNEHIIVEIVRPGTGDPVPEGEVGEVVVTGFNPAYPLLRLGTGDLSAVLAGASPCGRTNTRIRGWMGRADQRTKVKGMFVDPAQIAEVTRRHAGIARARLVVTRDGEMDVMTLHVEPTPGQTLDADSIAVALRDATRLGGHVALAQPGSLPNDGKVISDERDYTK